MSYHQANIALMNRIDLKLFDRVKLNFPSDRHELRREARNYRQIRYEFQDWKSELDLPKNYPTHEMQLYYLAINTAIQHFESSLEFAQGLEYLLEEKRANIMPAICMLLRQTLESAFTASWLCSEPDIRTIANRGYKITVRDLNNLDSIANKLQDYDALNYNLKFIDVDRIHKQKLDLLIIGNEMGFSGKEARDLFNPLISRLYKNITLGGEKHNLTWAYLMLSAIGHGSWLGFYPSEKDITNLIRIKDKSLRVTLNHLKTRVERLVE